MEAWAGRPIAFKPATFYLEIVSAPDATISFALPARLTAGFYRRITLRNKASKLLRGEQGPVPDIRRDAETKCRQSVFSVHARSFRGVVGDQ